MTTAKKKPEPKDEAPEPDEKPDAKKDDGPVVETEVTWNGLTAHDTIDGEAQTPRPATLAEQLSIIAPDLLSLVVGSVPYATSGSIDVDGEKLTIQLVSH